jgi:hypothetical protein
MDFTPAGQYFVAQCHPCSARLASEYRRANLAQVMEHNREYRRSRPGIIVKCYHDIVARVRGGKYHSSYVGLPVMPRREFYRWAMCQPDLVKLLGRYRDSGYNREQAPTLARIDRRRGYVAGNLKWTTFEANRRGPKIQWKTPVCPTVAHRKKDARR